MVTNHEAPPWGIRNVNKAVKSYQPPQRKLPAGQNVNKAVKAINSHGGNSWRDKT